MNTMTEKEKAISQLCIAAQEYCKELREEDDIGESYTWRGEPYTLDCIADCIEQIHRLVNPEFNDICGAVEEAMEGDDDES